MMSTISLKNCVIAVTTAASLALLGDRAFALAVATIASPDSAKAHYYETTLFQQRTGPYTIYRIPSLVATRSGALLAFVEGRADASDSGDIDVLLRRSDDNGDTWGVAEVIADKGSDTIGNPCVVVDRQTGSVWLFLTSNPGSLTQTKILQNHPGGSRTVWLTHSEDDGRTWAPIREVTNSTKDSAWTWIATGPGIGIQLQSGRLVIPFNFYVNESVESAGSGVIVSDDHGRTWRRAGTTGPGTDETQVVEQFGGALMMNSRYPLRSGHRAVSVSADRGETWSSPKVDQALIEPVCEGSILRFEPVPGVSKQRILFSNPASGSARENLTLRVSYNDGATWAFKRSLYAGTVGYSCLTRTSDGQIGVLFERGPQGAPFQIVFARTDIAWVTSGVDKK